MGTLLHLLQVVDALFAGVLPSMKSDKSDTHKKGLISLKSLIRKWKNGENFDKKLLIAKKWSCLLLQNIVFAEWKAWKWWFYGVNQWKIRCFDFCCVQNVHHRKPQKTTEYSKKPQNTTEYNQYKIYEEFLQEFWNWGKEIAHYSPRNNAENSGFAIISSKSIYFLQALPSCIVSPRQHSMSSRHLQPVIFTIFMRRMVNLNYSQELKRINARKTT